LRELDDAPAAPAVTARRFLLEAVSACLLVVPIADERVRASLPLES